MSVQAAGTLPRAHGDAVLEGRMRVAPEDFRVEELPGFEPSGSGEHLLLTIEKRGMNTAFVARRLAEWAGVGEVAIGYAGLKDRHAVTQQRFTVHLPRRVAPDIASLESDDPATGERLHVVGHAWHSKKLPRGALAGNRFTIVLRDVTGDRGAIGARLEAVIARGVPNYFGEQRFGRGGDNVMQALAMFAGRRFGREQRSVLTSAARSELFNRVLAARIRGHCWDRPLDGEVWMLDGTRSVFGPQPLDETLVDRLARFDIHPTGPLWGRGELRSSGECARLELAALEGDDAARLRSGLERADLRQERRALRLRPQGLDWTWPDPSSLELRFELPPGTYATAVLDELGTVHAAPGA